LVKQITGEAKVDFTVYRHFSEFQLFKSRNPKLRKRAFYGLGIVSSILLALLGLTLDNINYLFLGAAMVVFLSLFSYITKHAFRKQCRLNANLLRATQSFVFAPEGFIFESNDEGNVSRDEVFYSDLYSVYDVKDAYYLYKDKKHAFIVPKNSIKKVTPEQTRAFLQSKVPNYKYIVVKQ